MIVHRLACFVGLFGVIAGCSGEYNVGMGGGGAPAGGSANNGSAGAAATTAAAGASGGGAMAAAGYGGAEIPSYCGQDLPSGQLSDFAPPAVLAERIQRFIIGSYAPETNLPATATRAWVTSYALNVLDSVSSASTPGMRRFVNAWWPGNQNADLWASYFSSRHGTFGDLLQSDAALDHGAGVLTDPVVLEQTSISRRAAYLSRRLFCQAIPPGPQEGDHVPPMPWPSGPRRDVLEQQTAAPACKACHGRYDALGYSLEHFARDGTYLTTDAGQPIVSSGSLSHAVEMTFDFSDVNDLGVQASSRCEVISCFSRNLLEDARTSANLSGSDLQGFEVALLARAIDEAHGDLRQAIVAAVTSDRFLAP